jgi:hypothetical protein
VPFTEEEVLSDTGNNVQELQRIVNWQGNEMRG